MPWQEVSAMSLRQEFVALAEGEEANIRELCRRFNISPKTGYKWLGRYQTAGEAGLMEGSRRPFFSPGRTPAALEAAVLAVREAHSSWGGRKIQALLKRRRSGPVPSPSTITSILHRHGKIASTESQKHKAFKRFEHPHPNDLWQMDFKGYFHTGAGRCHPLTLLDDHSRFALALFACADERRATVQERLSLIFQRYGLPHRMLMDNGSPWGFDQDHPYTALTVWLLRLGIGVSHGRPYHPQTQGKEERFHKTLKAEVLRGKTYRDLVHVQGAFDAWRDVYNLQRPHEALALDTPAKHYEISPRPFPKALPSIEYGPGDLVRRVSEHGKFSFQNRPFRVGKAFKGLPVALRPTAEDGVWDVFFISHRLRRIDLHEPTEHTC